MLCYFNKHHALCFQYAQLGLTFSSPPCVLVDVISGPFSNQEMAEWFQAGYFTMSLLVKRACDETFQPLGDIMKMWGRVPFTPGPAPLPHLVIVTVTVFQ